MGRKRLPAAVAVGRVDPEAAGAGTGDAPQTHVLKAAHGVPQRLLIRALDTVRMRPLHSGMCDTSGSRTPHERRIRASRGEGPVAYTVTRPSDGARTGRSVRRAYLALEPESAHQIGVLLLNNRLAHHLHSNSA